MIGFHSKVMTGSWVHLKSAWFAAEPIKTACFLYANSGSCFRHLFATRCEEFLIKLNESLEGLEWELHYGRGFIVP